MDFTVESLHTTEKKLNSEMVRLMKAVNVSSVADLKKSALNKLNKGPLVDFLENLVELFDNNLNLCKAAASSVDELKSKVMDSQNQLLKRQQEDLLSVKDTVQTEMKSWADVVKKSDKQTRQLTAKSVKEAVKAVNEEEERSKNLIVYGAQDDDESEWGYSCKVDKTTDTFTAICDQLECENVDVQHCTRIGEWRADRTRPIKVEFRTAADVETVLRKAHKLKASDEFKKVYLAPDRSAEERAAHSKLVNQMKELIKKNNRTLVAEKAEFRQTNVFKQFLLVHPLNQKPPSLETFSCPLQLIVIK
ncbi:hypothetical protein ACHWQZ_G007050 [Mnemiopsis leidyi]